MNDSRRYQSLFFCHSLVLTVFLTLLATAAWPVTTFADAPSNDEILFQIGYADAWSNEFNYYPFQKALDQKLKIASRFVVGSSPTWEWPRMHLSTRDYKNAGHKFTFEIEFTSQKDYSQPLFFVVGVTFGHGKEPSLLKMTLNGQKLPERRAPQSDMTTYRKGFRSEEEEGAYMSVSIPIPGGLVKKGSNLLTLTLDDGSWFYYDYVTLKTSDGPLPRLIQRDLLAEFKAQEFKQQAIHEILFVVRKPGFDPHWYANFGYYALDENTFPFPLGTGAKLCIYNLDTKKVRTIFETKTGSIRDPQLYYDAKKLVFSYLPDGKRHFNLYEINIDGTGLRQLTSGDWDDIEPAYLPCGDIVFCSSRAKRWVQCWLTPVATIHRCDANGGNIRPLSCNIEHDNTPWVLNNGQILYMRWEYVDRSQIHYHHLWTMNPDGTRQQVFFGNLHPGQLFIDAKPVPQSDDVVVLFSPGHGRREHYGRVMLLSPRSGPDEPQAATAISRRPNYGDPWAFSEKAFMAVSKWKLMLLAPDGIEQTIYELPNELTDEDKKRDEEERKALPDTTPRKYKPIDRFWIHEPRPILTRMREPIIAENTDDSSSTGFLLLTDIYQGRQMRDVKRGSIKELLVCETLPEPIHFNGGMEQISRGGTFTLERILGTVPVEPDGSAFMEIPAMRPVFFIAYDHENRPVKRMHSFTSVMPGETTTCIGCHEDRTEAPSNALKNQLFRTATRGAVSPRPVPGIPDVFCFTRDIQPVLDRYCVKCHHYERRDDGVDLSGDWTCNSTMSYLTLSERKLFGDNRNRPMSNFTPYEIGSSASHLYELITSGHEGVNVTEADKKLVQYWLDLGANYAGTYAANGNVLLRSYNDRPLRLDDWPETKAMGLAIHKRCQSCHDSRNRPLPKSPSGTGRYGYKVFNYSRPQASRLLRAPLAKSAGGLEICKTNDGKPVFADVKDADYQTILAAINRGRKFMTVESQRFDAAPKIVPNRSYIREMIRFGILRPDHDEKTPVDPYAIDRKYWDSFLYVPKTKAKANLTPQKLP